MTVDQLLKPDPPRDRFGRYLLRLPGDAKARGRTRVTTFIKALDQGDGLIAWKATATMVGALRNPGLHAKWAAIFAQSQDPWYHSDDLKTKCKKLVDECADHGGAQSRADLGTALHSMLELVARHRNGEGDMPSLVDPYAADIQAFLATLDKADIGFTGWNEVCVYIPDYDLVGTFDALTDPIGTPTAPLTITDYKTETSTDYKALAHAAQLAAYSLATHRIVWPQDPDGEATLEPLPTFDHDTGLIIHLPAGQAQCTLHAVDLGQGREALELASSMRRLDAQRKRKDTGGLMRPWTPSPTPPLVDLLEQSCADAQPVITAKPGPGPDTPPPNPTPMQTNGSVITPTEPSATTNSEPCMTTPPSEQSLKHRLREIHQHQPDLAHLIGRRWPPGVPAIRETWNQDQTNQVSALLDEVDIEGPMLDESETERMRTLFLSLDPNEDKNNRVQQWFTEAASDPTRYRPLALGAGNHTTRRITLAETCLLVAGNDVDDYDFIDLIDPVITDPVAVLIPIGHALGTLNWRQAQHLLTLTRLHLNLHTTIETIEGGPT